MDGSKGVKIIECLCLKRPEKAIDFDVGLIFFKEIEFCGKLEFL